MQLTQVPDEASLAALAAEKLATALRQALALRPTALLAVPGGRSPRTILPLLAALDLDWGRVVVTLTDERWVDPNHPDSNEAQARRLLPPQMRLVGLKNAADTPELGLAEAEARLQALPMPFDALLLGMGEDGHVASLFPGFQPPPAEALAMSALAPNGVPRLSLTPQALLSARTIVLPVSGAEKRATLERALGPGPVSEMPVRLVLHQAQVIVATG